MTTPTANWHRTPAAQAILASLTAEDVGLFAHIGLSSGSDRYRWSAGEKHEQLDAIRSDAIVLALGNFQDAYNEGRALEYFDFCDAVPEVEDVLADRFGDPTVLFGSPSWIDRVTPEANAAARAVVAGVIAGRAAA